LKQVYTMMHSQKNIKLNTQQYLSTVQVCLHVKVVIVKQWERQPNIRMTFSIYLWNLSIFNSSFYYIRLLNTYDENLTFFRTYVTKKNGLNELVNKFRKVSYVFQNTNPKSYIIVYAEKVREFLSWIFAASWQR